MFWDDQCHYCDLLDIRLEFGSKYWTLLWWDPCYKNDTKRKKKVGEKSTWNKSGLSLTIYWTRSCFVIQMNSKLQESTAYIETRSYCNEVEILNTRNQFLGTEQHWIQLCTSLPPKPTLTLNKAVNLTWYRLWISYTRNYLLNSTAIMIIWTKAAHYYFIGTTMETSIEYILLPKGHHSRHHQ